MQQMLRKQLELVRFEKTIDYVASHAHGLKHLNSTELAVLNNMLCGEGADKNNDKRVDPWRVEPVTINLPSGRKEQIALLDNPIVKARDLINESRDLMNDDRAEGASHLYSQLVLHHLFKDANRRTAVAAVAWLLMEVGIQIPAMGLLELGLGDLRSEGQLSVLKNLINNTVQLSKKKP